MGRMIDGGSRGRGVGRGCSIHRGLQSRTQLLSFTGGYIYINKKKGQSQTRRGGVGAYPTEIMTSEINLLLE